MTFLARQAFAKQFKQSPDDLDMHVVSSSTAVSASQVVLVPPQFRTLTVVSH